MRIKLIEAFYARGGLKPEPRYLEFNDWNQAIPELFKLHARLIVESPNGIGIKNEDVDWNYQITLYNDYVE